MDTFASMDKAIEFVAVILACAMIIETIVLTEKGIKVKSDENNN